jgi:hypothetical protein
VFVNWVDSRAPIPLVKLSLDSSFRLAINLLLSGVDHVKRGSLGKPFCQSLALLPILRD